MPDQIIRLSPDELNRLQAALDAPMTIEDAEDVLSEFGFTELSSVLEHDVTEPQPFQVWYDTASGKSHVCKDAEEVIALAQEELEKEIV